MKKLGLILIVLLFTGSVNGQISYLQYRHVPADQEAKLLYKDPNIKEAVWDYFGNTVFNQQKEVDFKKLASSNRRSTALLSVLER